MIRSLITLDGHEAVLADLGRPVLASNEVRVRVEVAMISRAPELRPDRSYAVLGTEFTGIIVECGAAVVAWRTGDRVLGTVRAGACAEEICVSAAALTPAPPHVDAVHMTLVPISGLIAAAAVDLAAPPASGLVLVTGAGGGSSCMLAGVLRHHGAVPIASCRSAESVEELRDVGFDSVLAGSTCPTLLDLDQVTAGRPLAAIIDCSYNQRVSFDTLAMAQSAKIVRVRASTIAGFTARADNEIGLRLTDWVAADRQRTAAAVELVLDLLRDGRAMVPIERYSLTDGPKAWDHLCSRRAIGKIAIDCR